MSRAAQPSALPLLRPLAANPFCAEAAGPLQGGLSQNVANSDIQHLDDDRLVFEDSAARRRLFFLVVVRRMPAFSAGVAASPLTWARNSAAAIHFGKQRPYLLTGWLWYIVMLAPVIGIVHRQFSVDMTAEVFSP